MRDGFTAVLNPNDVALAQATPIPAEVRRARLRSQSFRLYFLCFFLFLLCLLRLPLLLHRASPPLAPSPLTLRIEPHVGQMRRWIGSGSRGRGGARGITGLEWTRHGTSG